MLCDGKNNIFFSEPRLVESRVLKSEHRLSRRRCLILLFF